MTLFHWIAAFRSRRVPPRHRPPTATPCTPWSERRPQAEALESRIVLASAGGVENILLPEFMAQMADPNGNQLPASDAWWALRSQRNMAIKGLAAPIAGWLSWAIPSGGERS